MKIVDILRPEAIIPSLQSAKRDDVLVELAEQIHRAYPRTAPDASVIAHRLLEREVMGSTSVGEGLAIPHCRMPNLTQTLAALGVCREGIQMSRDDERPARLFVALVSPTHSIGPHLRVLARVCRLFKGTPLLTDLMELTTVQEIYDSIVSFEQKL